MDNATAETSYVDTTGICVNRSAMSRALGTDLAHISRIFSGQRKPSFKLAARIAEYMGISLDELDTLLKEKQSEQENKT